MEKHRGVESKEKEILGLDIAVKTKLLELSEYTGKDKSTLTSRVAELTEIMSGKNSSYRVITNSISELEDELNKKIEILNEVLRAKNDMKEKSSEIHEESTRLAHSNLSSTKELEKLMSTKSNILNNLSSECEACPHNKMADIVSDLKISIKEVNKALKETTNKDKACEVAKVQIIKAIEQTEKLEEDCTKVINEINNKLSPLRQEEYSLKQSMHEIKTEIQGMSNQLKESNSDIDHITRIEGEINNLRIEKEKLEEAIREANKSGLEESIYNYNIEITNYKSDSIAAEDTMTELKRIEHDIDVKVSNIDIVVSNLNESLKEGNDLESKKQIVEREKKDVLELIENRNITKKVFINELQYYNFWKVGCSSVGMEGYMLDTVINKINAHVHEYLSYLSNNTMSLSLVPDSKLKSGETRNKISVEVDNTCGGGTYDTNSAGERRLMDIAVLFALKNIYSGITGTRYNVLFMDETFNKLDSTACELVVNLVHTIKEITSILIISHIEFPLAFDSEIKAVKTNKITEIIDEDFSN
jgi:DNA repair exonuclease SbcCD ATPase subunit